MGSISVAMDCACSVESPVAATKELSLHFVSEGLCAEDDDDGDGEGGAMVLVLAEVLVVVRGRIVGERVVWW